MSSTKPFGVVKMGTPEKKPPAPVEPGTDSEKSDETKKQSEYS